MYIWGYKKDIFVVLRRKKLREDKRKYAKSTNNATNLSV